MRARPWLHSFSCASPRPSPATRSPHSNPGLDPILKYIATGWDTLTRSMTDCNTVVDPKLAEDSILYLPAGLSMPDSVREMQQRCHIKVEHLPRAITGPGQVSTNITPPGLLYLPNKYVVPGGRFNEMYGWDTYFIVRGLVEDKRLDLARGIIENFFFEIEHYGTVLNANRTYFLTRSQPPFLTSMILSVYEAEKAAGKNDRELLEQGYKWASKDYEMWNRDPHLAGDTGLSRYFDFGNGPAPESLKDETDAYRRVAGYFLLHAQGRNYITEVDEPQAAQSPEDQRKAAAAYLGARYAVQVCNAQRTMAKAECDPSRDIFLTADYYKGDRAMRESGFDISFRFGPYGAGTHHFAPVCLNSLLYKTEKDLEQIAGILGRREDAQALGRPRPPARRARAEASVGRAERYVFRLQPRCVGALDLPLHHDVLSVVGGHRDQGAGRGPAQEPADLRTSGRPGHERCRCGRAVGPALRLGAHTTDRD